jgi:hypothetical protein
MNPKNDVINFAASEEEFYATSSGLTANLRQLIATHSNL